MVTYDDIPDKFKKTLKALRDNILSGPYCTLKWEIKGLTINKIERAFKISKEGLDFLKEKVDKKQWDGFTCGTVLGNEYRYVFRLSKKERTDLVKQVNNWLGGYWELRGVFCIPPGGFLGWHTNANASDPRMYIVWNEKDNHSIFYHENKEGDIIERREAKGWRINHFKAPHWHSAKADAVRFSVGFRPISKSRFKKIYGGIENGKTKKNKK